MKNMRVFRFLKNLGLISRLMIAVGVAIVAGGGVQTVLLVAEGAAEHSARLLREQKETLLFLAPLVADQALVGDYAAITQLLKNQVKKGELDRFAWTDKDGKTLIAQDLPDRLDAPAWFARLALIEHEEQSLDVTAGGVGYGKLSVWVTPVKAHNRLWLQFVKQLQIVAVTLFLMLQFIWLIFRGNLGTLRMLAEGANRFSQGDHAVRIEPEGAPEVGLAAEAFNNMANNIEGLIASLGKSESKNKLLATIVEQSSEAIWTKDLAGIITSWNSGAAAMFGYPPADAVGRALDVGESTAEEEEARMQRLMAGEKFSYDARAMTRSGTAIDIQVAVAPLLDQANQWIGSISVARDVTQHKRSEEALRLAREAAESANHAKSSFLARMSHEIRTPMNGVLGMTELLLETGLTSAQRKYAETVQRSGQNQRSSAIPHLRGVCPGRRINDPQARRLRPRPRDQQAARRNDGGEHLRRIRARRRFHVLVHQPLRKAGNARLACGPDGDAYGRAGAHRRIERHQWRHPSLADEQLGNDQSGRRNAGAGDRSACPGGGTKRSLRYCNHRPGAAGHGRARTRAHDQGPRRHRQAAAGLADSPPGGYAERTRRGHRRLPGQAGASDGAV